MRAPFPPWVNTAAKLTVAGGAATALGTLGALSVYVRTPYNTEQLQPLAQPIAFDHRHHVQDAHIDCLYCHYDAERSPVAGLPATEVCMGCHDQILPTSPLLASVRESYYARKPLAWNRVHALPDFVFFDHSAHLRAGFDCSHCHGRVEDMARVYQVAPLTMQWCLECHRDPQAHRARSADIHPNAWAATVTNLEPGLPNDDRRVTDLTTCTTCHR